MGTHVQIGMHIQVELPWFGWLKHVKTLERKFLKWKTVSNHILIRVAAIQKRPRLCQNWNLRLRWLLWIYHSSAVGPCNLIGGQLSSVFFWNDGFRMTRELRIWPRRHLCDTCQSAKACEASRRKLLDLIYMRRHFANAVFKIIL